MSARVPLGPHLVDWVRLVCSTPKPSLCYARDIRSQFEQAHCIRIEHFVRGRGIRTKPSHHRQLLRPDALGSLTHCVVAIAAENQAILMPLEKLACVVLVALHGV